MSRQGSEVSSDAESSDCNSSCELDSESGTPSSPGSSCGIASPRPDNNENKTKPAPVPKLGLAIPRLDLGATSASPAAEPPAQPSQQVLPVRPALNLSGIRESPGQVQPAQPRRNQMAIELLSPAFQITQMSGGADAVTSVQTQCASNLGVRPDRVQLYALVPVSSPDNLPAGSERLAIQVQGSGFSLQAIEEVLKENQKLSEIVSSTSHGANTQELELLRQEVAHLRQRLKSSELLRQRGQQALQELKEEFETLHFDLMQHTDNVLSARTPRPAGMELLGAAGHQ